MNPNIEPTNQGHRILVLALTILLTAGAVGGGVYYVLNQQNKAQQKLIDELQKQNETKTEAKKTETTAVKDETADWKTYTSTKYNFSFKYPSGWSVSEDHKQATIEEPYFILDSAENVLLKNDSKEKAIVFNAGEREGRGGLCVKYVTVYKTNLANDKLNIEKKSDTVLAPDPSEDSMCQSVLGYEFIIEPFKYNAKEFWIRTNSNDEASVEEDKKLFEKVADSMELIDK